MKKIGTTTEFDPNELVITEKTGVRVEVQFLRISYPHDRGEAVEWTVYGYALRKDGQRYKRPGSWSWSWNYDIPSRLEIKPIIEREDPRS